MLKHKNLNYILKRDPPFQAASRRQFRLLSQPAADPKGEKARKKSGSRGSSGRMVFQTSLIILSQPPVLLACHCAAKKNSGLAVKAAAAINIATAEASHFLFTEPII